jgi:hypothetical protein
MVGWRGRRRSEDGECRSAPVGRQHLRTQLTVTLNTCLWGSIPEGHNQHGQQASKLQDGEEEGVVMREVTANEFVARLSPQEQMEVQANLDQGMGMALYYDGRSSRHAVSFGPRDADIVGLPPKMYGGGELDLFVSPRPAPANMRSPLLDAVGGPPQIRRPPVAPSQTSWPEVSITMRTSAHPRGDSEYISAQRWVPEPHEEVSEAPLSPEAAWWRDRLGQR